MDLVKEAQKMLDTLNQPHIDDSEELLMWLMTTGKKILEDYVEKEASDG
jgi:hypothetical protein